MDPSADGAFYALADSLYRSRDRGSTWQRVSDIRLDNLVVEPGDPNVLYASRSLPERAVLKSIDGGMNWSEVIDGLPPLRWLYLRAAGPGHVYGTEGNEVYETTNGALTWRRVSQGIFGVSAMAIDPTNARRLYVAVYSTGTFGTVLRSDDGGVTWARGSGSDGHPKEDIAVDPNNPSMVYAGASCCAQLFKSVDGGRNWTSLRAPSGVVFKVIVTGWGSLLVGVRQGPTVLGQPVQPTGVFQSFDGGQSWQPLNSGLEPPYISHLALSSSGKHLLALPSFGAGTLIYEFGQVPSVPGLSDWGRLILVGLLAAVGFLVSRGLLSRS